MPIGRRPSLASAKSASVHLTDPRRAAAAQAAGALAGRTHPDVALDARVRAAGPQADQRIDDERQPLDIDLNLLDGFGGGEFVDRADGQNRLALIDRLVGESALAQRIGRDPLADVGHGVGGLRQIVHREDGLDAGHRQRLAAHRCCARARAAPGSAAACRTACRRRDNLRRTSLARSPSRPGRAWCSSCRSACRQDESESEYRVVWQAWLRPP